MKNSIAIEIIHKECSIPLAGLDDLKEELSKEYIFQIRSYWGPAAEGHFDAISKLFFNTSLRDFLLTIVVSGITWDLIKIGTEYFFINPFINSIEKFLNKNHKFEYLSTNLQFNDVKIEIIGKPNDLHKTFADIIEAIIQRQDILFNYNGYTLYEIVTPIIKEEGKNNFYTMYPRDNHSYLEYWGLRYKPGFHNYVLDLKTNTINKHEWS